MFLVTNVPGAFFVPLAHGAHETCYFCHIVITPVFRPNCNAAMPPCIFIAVIVSCHIVPTLDMCQPNQTPRNTSGIVLDTCSTTSKGKERGPRYIGFLTQSVHKMSREQVWKSEANRKAGVVKLIAVVLKVGNWGSTALSLFGVKQ